MNTLEHNAMALNDWSQSEPAPKQEFEKTTAKIDLTLEICSEDRSHTQFYQNNENGISKILQLLIAPQIFTQPFLTMVSGRSISTIPCRTIDMILVRTQALPPLPPLLLPPGLLDIVEVGAEEFHNGAVLSIVDDALGEDQPMGVEEVTSYVEIHTIGDWMIGLGLRIANQATIQDQRQFLAQLIDLPVIPFHLKTGGVGFINPTKISRVTVYTAFKEVDETGLPVDLVRCVRS